MTAPGYKACPVCAETIREAAKACRFCGAVLTGTPQSGVAEVVLPTVKASPVEKSASPLETARLAIKEDYSSHGVDLTEPCWRRIERVLASRKDQYCEATVLYVDVSSLTGLFDKASADELQAHLKQLYGLCAHHIALYNGFIARFVGDAMIAVFGAPEAYDGDVESAVRAALEIREAVNLLPPFHGQTFTIRGGIDPGLVMFTVLQTPDRVKIDVIGEPVDVAQRLHSQARPGEILISGATHKAVKPLVEAEPLGTLTMINVAEPVEAYRMLRFSEGAVVRREFATRFVGRQREIGLLRELIESTLDGRGPKLVALEGDPGIGKTRLIWEVLRPFLPRVQLLHADCEPHAARTPFSAILAMLRGLFELNADPTTEEIRTRIDEYFEDNPLVDEEQIACFHYLFMLRPGIEKYSQMPAAALRQTILATLIAFLRGLLARGPVVMFIDNLRWVDPSSVDLLSATMEAEGLNELILVVAGRPDHGLGGRLEERVEKIELGPLSKDERLELLKWIVDDKTLGTEVRDAILRNAAGDPKYMEEAAGSILEIWEKAEPDKGEARVQDVVPDSMQGIIQARINALEHRTGLVFQCGAVLGLEFTFRLLELFDTVREGLLSRLYILRGLHFLQDRPDARGLEFMFHHGRSREMPDSELVEKQKRRLHSRIARQLEEKFSETEALDSNCSVLAYHYLHSDNPERALHWLLQSARHAEKVFANDEALDLYEQAMVILQDMSKSEDHRRQMADILRARGRLLRFSGRMEESDESIQSLEAVADDLKDDQLRADALAEKGMNLYQHGRYAESDKLLERAAELFETTDNRAGIARVQNALGRNRLAVGDLDGALKWLDRAQEIGIEQERPGIAADICNNRGLVLWRQHKYAPALESLRRAQSLWHEVHNHFGLCATTLNVGILEENLGRLNRALENYENALQLAHKLDYGEAEATVLVNVGNALRRKGDIRRATETNARALELARRLERQDLVGAALQNLGLDELAANRPEEAFRHYEQALQAIGTESDPEHHASLLFALARTEVALDNHETAQEHLATGKEIVENGGFIGLQSARLLAEATLAARRTQPDASQLFEQAVEAARAIGNPWYEKDALEAWKVHCESHCDDEQRNRIATRLREIDRDLRRRETAE